MNRSLSVRIRRIKKSWKHIKVLGLKLIRITIVVVTQCSHHVGPSIQMLQTHPCCTNMNNQSHLALVKLITPINRMTMLIILPWRYGFWQWWCWCTSDNGIQYILSIGKCYTVLKINVIESFAFHQCWVTNWFSLTCMYYCDTFWNCYYCPTRWWFFK